MMKNLFKFICTIPLFILLVSCASDDEIADELIDYYNNEWIPIHDAKESKMKTMKNTFMNLAINLEEGNEADVKKESIEKYETDVIPTVDKVIEQYESIQLNHRQVKKLNKKQIKVEKTERDYLESIIDYVNGDISVSKHREMENQLKEVIHEVNDYLEKLMEKYNLEYDKTKERTGGFYEIKRKEE